MEAIPFSLVGWDFGIVFGILYFFMYLSSDAQVRGDVRLGRLSPKQFSVSGLRGVGVLGAAVGLLLPRLGGLDGGVLILSLCGFFFVLLLLEPLFFRHQAPARFAQ